MCQNLALIPIFLFLATGVHRSRTIFTINTTGDHSKQNNSTLSCFGTKNLRISEFAEPRPFGGLEVGRGSHAAPSRVLVAFFQLTTTKTPGGREIRLDQQPASCTDSSSAFRRMLLCTQVESEFEGFAPKTGLRLKGVKGSEEDGCWGLRTYRGGKD